MGIDISDFFSSVIILSLIGILFLVEIVHTWRMNKIMGKYDRLDLKIDSLEHRMNLKREDYKFDV